MPVKLSDDPLPWECLDKEYLFRRPPWLILRHQRFRLPTGREIADYWISEYPPWVKLLPVAPEPCRNCPARARIRSRSARSM